MPAAKYLKSRNPVQPRWLIGNFNGEATERVARQRSAHQVSAIFFASSYFFCNSRCFFLLEGSDRELCPNRTRGEKTNLGETKPVKTSHSVIATNQPVRHGKRGNSGALFVLPRVIRLGKINTRGPFGIYPACLWPDPQDRAASWFRQIPISLRRDTSSNKLRGITL